MVTEQAGGQGAAEIDQTDSNKSLAHRRGRPVSANVDEWTCAIDPLDVKPGICSRSRATNARGFQDCVCSILTWLGVCIDSAALELRAPGFESSFEALANRLSIFGVISPCGPNTKDAPSRLTRLH